ncbi:MAG: hypothetical protein SNG27_01385 [Rikenellaceae bacterium]
MATEQMTPINKIVANALIKNQAIYLPSIGSLWVEVSPSKLSSSSSEITPPEYIVKFSSKQNGGSIIDIIAQIVGGDTAKASTLYDDWLESVKTPKGANIKGVGNISHKVFNIYPTFDKLLNPEKAKAIQLKRRRRGWIWIAASVAVCAVVGVVANYSMQWYFSKPMSVEPQVITQEFAQEQIQEQPQEEQIQEQLQEQPQIAPDTVTKLTCTAPPKDLENPLYRVVYGVFSTPENAQKGAEMAYQANQNIIAKIRPFGEKYMVSIFSSDDIDDAKAFIEQHGSTYPDLWIYKRRGE